jgi:hypothetical protein
MIYNKIALCHCTEVALVGSEVDPDSIGSVNQDPRKVGRASKKKKTSMFSSVE